MQLRMRAELVRCATVAEYLHAANGNAMDDSPLRSSCDMGGRTPVLKIVALFAVIFSSALPGLACAGDWEVIAERNGIMLSRRPVEGRSFPELRSVGVVPGTPYEVVAILLDVPAHVDWRPDCVESKAVRKLDTWRSIVYTRTDAPWPISDREVVVENEVIFIEPPSKVKVTFRAIAAPDVERRQGTVRMKLATGFYAIEAIDDAHSRVHYEVDADPGGTCPTG